MPIGSNVGVTTKAVNISVSGPFSGVYGTLFNDIYAKGPQVWQDQINSSGGIFGRKINFVKVDNQFTADGAIAACKETTTNGSFMVMNIGGVSAEDDCEDSAGMPVLDDAPTATNPSWKHVIAAHVGQVFAPAEVSFLRSSYAKAANNKIGIIYNSDVPQYVEESQAIASVLRSDGMQLADQETITTNQSSFISQMTRMRSAGVQTVMLVVSLEGPGIIRDAHAIGYSPQFIATPNSGAATDLGAQASTGQFQGLIGIRWYTTTETPAYAAYVANVRKYEGESAAAGAGSIDIGTYSLADVLGKMLQLTGPNLGRQSFLSAAHTIANYYGGLTVPFTLAGERQPVGQYALWPIICCSSSSTWKTLGPYAQQF